MQTKLGHRVAHVSAELAVHGTPHLLVVGKGESDRVDCRDRHQRCHDQRGRREEVDAAAAYLRQHVRVAAQLIVGEDLDFDAALRFGKDPVGRFLRADVERVRQRQVVAVLERELRGVRERGETG
jgi:hypothetical protein